MINFIFNTGVYCGYPFRGSRRSSSENPSGVLFGDQDYIIWYTTFNFQSLDYGLVFGSGFEYKIDTKLYASFDTNIECGLNNLGFVPDDSSKSFLNKYSEYNIGFIFKVGFNYKI
ncbi:MAG: hypothetical protein VX710_04145 [Bacteroidota bacterium]|nr:hypothetical protein [Bacteroidota bacterium]